MMNFGALAAEIVSVFGAPKQIATGFAYVLASLLHGIRAVGASKLCDVEQRAPAIFGP